MPLISHHRLVLLMETGFVFCEVLPEGLYIIWTRVVVKLYVRCRAMEHDREVSGDLHAVIAGLQAKSQYASGRSCDRAVSTPVFLVFPLTSGTC